MTYKPIRLANAEIPAPLHGEDQCYVASSPLQSSSVTEAEMRGGEIQRCQNQSTFDLAEPLAVAEKSTQPKKKPQRLTPEQQVRLEYIAAAGWQRTDKDHINLGRADIREILDHGALVVGRDGKFYVKDSGGSNKIVSVDPDLLPDGEPWREVEVLPEAYFEKHRQLSSSDPKSVVQAFITEPTQNANDAHSKHLAALAALGKRPRDTELENAMLVARREEKVARVIQEVLQHQFDLMRNGIFHTDREEKAAAERLRRSGVTDLVELAEFRLSARDACTPDDIRKLEADAYQRHRERKQPEKREKVPSPAMLAGVQSSNRES